MKPAFEVDKAGLAKLLEQRGKAFAVLELIQNALDEDVTRVDVRLYPTPGSRGYYTLTVTDDSPEGFADLTHAYTLFAESKKKTNPELRGRFNLGEKLVLAVCRRAEIRTTTGVVRFEGNQRSHGRNKTEIGSVFTGELRMSKADAAEAIEAARMILVGPETVLTIDNERLPSRESVGSFEESLTTVVANDEGFLRTTSRKATVDIYEPRESETPMLYELGIPVVEIDCPWHVDVRQKIPLNTDRDNVTPAYARRLLALVLNAMHERASEEDLRAPWAGDALESEIIEGEAVDAILTARYGEKRVVRDPSDPESTKLAMAKGYAVVEPGAFNRQQWNTIRETGAVLPSGKVTPSPKPWSDDPDAPEAEVVPEEKWTPGMRLVVNYSRELARKLDITPRLLVRFVLTNNNFGACYGDGRLTFNLKRLGHQFFSGEITDKLNALLIHEFGHEDCRDHLSEDYYKALCNLGAKLTRLALEHPRFFEGRDVTWER
jgi:hypothetical protein